MKALDEIVKAVIPIYTDTNPHPIKNRADCRLEKHYKEGQRVLMKKELQAVIEKFKTRAQSL